MVLKLLGQNPKDKALKGRGTKEADSAIREARAGLMPVPNMLRAVLAAQVFVPLAAPPVMEGNSIKSWKPATVTKPAGGAEFLVAFTDASLAEVFTKSASDYTHGLLINVQWLLSALPNNHGIVFNIGGTDSNFEWSAEGISDYKVTNAS